MTDPDDLPRHAGAKLLLLLFGLLLAALLFVFRVELGFVAPPPPPGGFTDASAR